MAAVTEVTITWNRLDDTKREEYITEAKAVFHRNNRSVVLHCKVNNGGEIRIESPLDEDFSDLLFGKADEIYSLDSGAELDFRDSDHYVHRIVCEYDNGDKRQLEWTDQGKESFGRLHEMAYFGLFWGYSQILMSGLA